MSTVVSPPRQRGLNAGHFRKIATNGFGDGGNAYSWGCAWYKDHLYIGTNRLVLVLYKRRIRYNINTSAWPVEVNNDGEPLDMRGQVWRYSLDTDSWKRVFHSPMTEGVEGRKVPRACGFRHLTLFQGKSDPHPVIYSIPGCGFDSLGPTLLRCEDGENFVPSSKPGLGISDPNIVAYRGAISFKGRLFVSPAGYRGGHVNIAYGAPVFCSDDPVSGNWEASNTPCFGDPTNHGIFDIGVCGDYLYAGTINLRHGAQLWKTDGEGPAPHRWTKVFDCGADRGPFNQGIYCFAAFKGSLYLGTAVQNGGNDRENNIGPAAGEVIRVNPDDSWDVVMGEPRLTPRGLRLPTSGLGAGFDNPFNGYIWRMCAHDGALYVGTMDAFGYFSFANPEEWPKHVRRLLDEQLLENVLERRGGCELWRTIDGDHWTPVTLNGFGNPFNWGVRAMVSTPRGLFVGTANPFGPNVATRGAGGWRYEHNERGGLEVWHGAFENAGCGDMDASGMGLNDMDFLLNNVNPGTVPSQASERAAPAPALLAGQREHNPFMAGPATHDITSFLAPQEEQWRQGPISRLNRLDKDLQGLSESVEDQLLLYFGDTLQNVGYWSKRSMTPRQACLQLLHELLVFLPPRDLPGQMLVVGPQGLPLKTEILQRRNHWQICLAAPPRELVRSRKSQQVPLPFDNDAFDALLWVEGPELEASLFPLEEVRRVLKPSGCFLATELVGDSIEQAQRQSLRRSSQELLQSREAKLRQAGFEESRVLDITRKSWQSFCRHSREHFANKRLFQQLDELRHHEILSALPGGRRVIEANLMIVAGQWQAAPT